MRFGILGPLVVADDHGRELAVGGRRQRAVLAILLLHAGEVVSTDRLIDELWDERAPATAAKTLQVYVSNLRKALGHGVLLTRAGGYVLQAEPDGIDSVRFRAIVDEGRSALEAGEAQIAASRLREALGLWRGPALADFAHESFAQAEVARLEELRQAALEDRIDADLAHGDHSVLVGELEALVREHPMRERLTAQLMLALYRSGRQADALDAYQRARVQLQEELGLEPGPALKTLQMQVLEQSAELEVDIQTGDENHGAIAPGEPPAADALVAPRAERKVVTVVSVELVDVVEDIERDDPEEVCALLAPFQEHLRSELERFGGKVLQIIGEEVLALFGAPTAHEDDPERAVRAALSIRDWAAEQRDANVRVAVCTGEALITIGAVTGGGDTMGAGEVINLATRVRGHAPLNGILVGEHAYRATRGSIEYRAAPLVGAKGRGRPVAVWEGVRAISAPGPVLETRTPFVGRKHEFESVVSALDRACERCSCHFVTLVGVPGIGKSRLVYELHALVRRRPEAITWRQGRSLPYGEGVSYWALGEMVKQQAGILESDTPEQAAEKLRLAGPAAHGR
jgi:DNA-binding SARP family transcriptional activator